MVRRKATTTPWAGVSATARGSQHDRSGLPNQDAVTTRVQSTPVPATLAVVADGHGGGLYVRSDAGSRLAVEVTSRAVTELLPRVARVPAAAVADTARTELVPLIVERWQMAARRDAARRPFSAAELQRGGPALVDDPIVAYGATLLVALATDAWVLLVQIGDGDIVVSDVDGRTWSPVPGDERLAAGETTSLCLPDAAADARVAVVDPAERADLVVVSSDGYGNSFADRDWRTTVAGDLHRHLRSDGIEAVGANLPGWLADSARVGGDDASAAVLARTVPAASPPPGHRRRRFPALAAVAIVALAVGGAAGWALKSSPAATAPSDAAVAATVAVATSAPTSAAFVPTTVALVAPPPAATAPSPAAAAPPGVPLASIWGLNNELVVFRTDGQGAPVRYPGPLVNAAPPATSVTVAGVEWTVSGTTVVSRLGDGTTHIYVLRTTGGTITSAGGRIWVLSRDAKQLVALDPGTSIVDQPRDVLEAVAAPGGTGGNGG